MKRSDILTLAVSMALLLGCRSSEDANRAYTPYSEAEAQYAPPTEQQKLWALATSAILTERNRRRHDLLGGCDRTPKNIKAWQESLVNWWGVHNRKDLLETLDWIQEGGHRREFGEMARNLSSATPEQISQLKSKIAGDPSTSNQVGIVLKYKDEFNLKSIIAWDYARYISLCSWGYITGYMSEEEAWKHIMPAARLLQQTFDSWEDLGKNYVVGREFWSLPETQRAGDKTRQCYENLLKNPKSPWNTLPWDLDLNSPGAIIDSRKKRSVQSKK